VRRRGADGLKARYALVAELVVEGFEDQVDPLLFGPGHQLLG
jgi:hypothetical protein